MFLYSISITKMRWNIWSILSSEVSQLPSYWSSFSLLVIIHNFPTPALPSLSGHKQVELPSQPSLRQPLVGANINISSPALSSSSSYHSLLYLMIYLDIQAPSVEWLTSAKLVMAFALYTHHPPPPTTLTLNLYFSVPCGQIWACEDIFW